MVKRYLPEFVMLFGKVLVATYALLVINKEMCDRASQLKYRVIQIQLVLLVSYTHISYSR